MVYIASVFYAVAKFLYGLAALFDATSVGLKQQLGNPTIPDQLFILIDSMRGTETNKQEAFNAKRALNRRE